jgi:hypothetical protein
MSICPNESDLSAWIDGELSERERSTIESHIAHCESCSKIIQEFEQLRHTLHLDIYYHPDEPDEISITSSDNTSRWKVFFKKYSQSLVGIPAAIGFGFILASALALMPNQRAESNQFTYSNTSQSYTETSLPQSLSLAMRSELINEIYSKEPIRITIPSSHSVNLKSHGNPHFTTDTELLRDIVR